jgi:hypothetical protein
MATRYVLGRHLLLTDNFVKSLNGGIDTIIGLNDDVPSML